MCISKLKVDQAKQSSNLLLASLLSHAVVVLLPLPLLATTTSLHGYHRAAYHQRPPQLPTSSSPSTTVPTTTTFPRFKLLPIVCSGCSGCCLALCGHLVPPWLPLTPPATLQQHHQPRAAPPLLPDNPYSS